MGPLPGVKIEIYLFQKKNENLQYWHLRAVNFQGGLMVCMCYLSGTKDDTTCSAQWGHAVLIFPTGVIDSNSKRLKTTGLSAGLLSSQPQKPLIDTVCGWVWVIWIGVVFMALRLTIATHTLIYICITWGSCKNADY